MESKSQGGKVVKARDALQSGLAGPCGQAAWSCPHQGEMALVLLGAALADSPRRTVRH